MISFEKLISHEEKIAVVGLGYVGLPLAALFSKYFDVIGYDLKVNRIKELNDNFDRTNELTKKELENSKIFYSSNEKDISKCKFLIVAVPTPIDDHRIPDLKPLKSASYAVGRQIKKGACVVFESTVYPGATQEVCIPIIEKESGLKFGTDFTVGYSPERVNPGDKKRTIDKIIKVVSGSDEPTLTLLEKVYGKIVTAGIHKASSIKVAEAAKVIENTQRDLNIALMNELAMIFHTMGIDTRKVIEAAKTKWNFLPFYPGLVGGHCIGVDPYYLTFKAESLGYHPEMILAGRRINDNLGKYIAEKTVKLMIKREKKVRHTNVAVFGITFKEDVPDTRNTMVTTIINELKDYDINVLTYDPVADVDDTKRYYNINLVDINQIKDMDAIVVAVGHNEFANMGLSKIASFCSAEAKPIIVDVKGIFSKTEAETKNIEYWRL